MCTGFGDGYGQIHGEPYHHPSKEQAEREWRAILNRYALRQLNGPHGDECRCGSCRR